MSGVNWTIIESATGRVRRSGYSSVAADVPKPANGEERLLGIAVDGASFYKLNEDIVPRPTLSVPDQFEAGINQTIRIQGLPLGTRIRQHGLDAGEVDGDVTVQFAKRTATMLRLVPPFPYQDKDVEIVVDDRTPQQRADALTAAQQAIARRGLGGLK